MKDMLETRLAQLREEQATGERVLAELQSREAELRQTLLRIQGAIQVLQELLQQSGEGGGTPAADG